MAEILNLLFFFVSFSKTKIVEKKKKPSMGILNQDCLHAPCRSLAFYNGYSKNRPAQEGLEELVPPCFLICETKTAPTFAGKENSASIYSDQDCGSQATPTKIA